MIAILLWVLLSSQASPEGLYDVLLAEDARAPTSESLQTIITGTRNSDPAVRAVAVRALGRLERPGLARSITPLLADSDPGVRREAANALGQATLDATGSEPECLAVAAALTDRLALEGDSAVRGVILRTLGRLPHADDTRVRATEKALVVPLTRPVDEDEQDGAVRGLSRLFARRPGVERRLSPEAAAALGDVVRGRRDARTRRVALQTLAAGAALDDAVADAAWRDPEWETRRLAAQLGADLAGGDRRARQALTDASPQVRFEAVRTIGQRGQIPCGPIAQLVNDPDPHVARRALQTLALPCEDGAMRPVDILAGIAARDGEHARKDWRLAAAALGSFASACATVQASARPSSSCQRARDVARLHARGEPWQLRMHAAQPVGSQRDRDTLRQLARDSHPNVRAVAIEQLAAMKNDADADVVIAALSADDYQLVMTAARALKGRAHADAVGALRAAFDRLSARKSDTARDPLTAIRDTLAASGVNVTVPSSSPKAAPFSQPELADLRARPLRAIITMESGGTIELELLTGEAPATVARFVRLARQGVYDGLTFHRVEPNFVIQGGSPGANEYAGHDPYLRDEVGLVSHERGTVGISTRGHDTGDAQVFVNLVDNFRLDHRYTVFARVVRGMQVVDEVVEGGAMARVVIR